MKKERECYYLFLDLHGPETTYQPLFEVLHKLHAAQLEFGFPIWWFLGEPGSHDMYRSQIEAALPGWSIYKPEIRYCFVLMSSTGYTSSGEYRPAAGEL
jgi:hypothetical protein